MLQYQPPEWSDSRAFEASGHFSWASPVSDTLLGQSTMAHCSLYRPRAPGLLGSHDMATIILFQRLDRGWVREVHLHSSKRKKGKVYVLFRNSENRVFVGLEALTRHLEVEGEESSFLSLHNFLSDRDSRVVSNR